MKLRDLSLKLQNLCHDGYSLEDVFIDIEGNNTDLADIEVRKVTRLGDDKKDMIVLAAWNKNEKV